MAVYEHLYGSYEGVSHTSLSRFLVIPRYALRDVFKSKLFTTIFILCFIYPLIAMILVYLRHNANALALLQINISELLPIDASFFRTFLEVQGWFAADPDGTRRTSSDLTRSVQQRSAALFVTAAFPDRIRARQDGSHCFPLVSYNVDPGPARVLFPGVACRARLVVGKSVDDKGDRRRVNGMDHPALFACPRGVDDRQVAVVASGALLGLFFVPSAFGAIVNNLFLTRAGHLVSMWATMNSIWYGLFGNL